MKNNNEGFTLIEILVVLAISAVVLTGVYGAFWSQYKSYIVQKEIAMMQQNLRAAMHLMTYEIRMAGYDPKGDAGALITDAKADSISFTKDVAGESDGSPPDTPDGDINDSNENITYSLYTDSEGIKKLGRKNPNLNRPVARNIDELDFVYLDTDNVPIPTPVAASDIPNIRSVQITLVARSERSELDYVNSTQYRNLQNDPVGPAGAGYRRSSLSTQVKFRNLGL